MSSILVAGATGRIGRPVAELLLSRGHRVRGAVRDPQSAAAAELARRGAEVVVADFDDVAGLAAAARGTSAVVAAGTAHRAGPDGERRHGENLAEAVARAGAGPLVYVSGAGADRATGVPVLESKRAVERRIAQLDLPATILAPAYFMENAFNPWNLAALARGAFPLALAEDRLLQQVAVDDVVAMAALAAERTDELAGRRIEIASDELTGAEAAERLTRATGQPYVFERTPAEQLAPPLQRLFAWLDAVGFDIDLRALHERHPEVGWRSFERWAAAQAWPS
jgi:uncharacterized protein YbjT (DUF2867 family)